MSSGGTQIACDNDSFEVWNIFDDDPAGGYEPVKRLASPATGSSTPVVPYCSVRQLTREERKADPVKWARYRYWSSLVDRADFDEGRARAEPGPANAAEQAFLDRTTEIADVGSDQILVMYIGDFLDM